MAHSLCGARVATHKSHPKNMFLFFVSPFLVDIVQSINDFNELQAFLTAVGRRFRLSRL
jgi:hypothetical protein